MSDIQAAFERLNDVEATISSIQRSEVGQIGLAQRLALASLEARRDELRMVADALAERQMVDVCDYRIIPDSWGRYPVKAVSGAMATFQDMLTAFFSSVREHRPRHRALYDADIVSASTLNMAYSYSGSLGIVLYVPNDQLLPSESDLDLAFGAIVELSQKDSATGVRGVAEEFGRAAVRTFYAWSKVHIDYDLSADIKWKRGSETKLERLVQPVELKRVSAFIDQASDFSESTAVVEGVLVALDLTRHAFKLSFPESPDIHGYFDDAFNWRIPHHLPGNYRATVRKRTTTPLWSDSETVTWTLLDLEERK